MRTTLRPSVNLATGQIRIEEAIDDVGPMDLSVMPFGLELNNTRDRINETLGRHHVHIAETRDAMTRAALIRLGWTPPANDPVVGDAPTSDETRMRVRANDAGSSVIAAEVAAAFAGSHCERILRAMGQDELSSHQIAQLSGLTVVQVDRRLGELRRDREIDVVCVDGEELLRAGYRVWRRIR